MNDEIKEILDILQNCKDYDDEVFLIKQHSATLLLDYITNLQNENERLKVKCNNSTSHQINYEYFKTLYSIASKDIVIDDLVYKCEDLDNLKQSYEKLYIEKEDYKSRCEKAIEYNNQIIKDTKDFYRPTTDIIYSGDSLIEIATNNINILQNGSEKNEC
jgi:hypothetical protein